MRENCTCSLSGGRWPARKRATSDPTPQLRALAARAPYFSNGSAKTLRDVVEFYNKRYGNRYTEQEKQDLANFLSAL